MLTARSSRTSGSNGWGHRVCQEIKDLKDSGIFSRPAVILSNLSAKDSTKVKKTEREATDAPTEPMTTAKRSESRARRVRSVDVRCRTIDLRRFRCESPVRSVKVNVR
ncbi:uncharacterized protein G2W53_029627 [Senna tora]|uniref:Uncharacterized protein n=1 Tax=Senna tora TaxID=362788 RepID=A0A834WC27_9FABA|nr:uncharacterized protein G2W53_029627 [Senna tora]